MAKGDRYVIVEWNQASGNPSLVYGGDLYDDEVDALEDARGLWEENRSNGRRENYAVARVSLWDAIGADYEGGSRG